MRNYLIFLKHAVGLAGIIAALVAGINFVTVSNATAAPATVGIANERSDFNPAFDRQFFNRPAFDRPDFNPLFDRPVFDPFFNRPVFNPFFDRPVFNPFFRPFFNPFLDVDVEVFEPFEEDD